MVHILALLARAGHGKTTLAHHLRDAYGAHIVSLTGPLKRCAQKVMRFSDAQISGTQAEKEAVDPRYGFSARTFLQRLGTEGLRDEFGLDVHVRGLFHEIEEIDAQSDAQEVFVIDDVRFPNEVETVVTSEQYHGVCIKIVCTDAPATPSGDHPSEAGIDHVPPELLAATVVSSRAQGVGHLVLEFEKILRSSPRLAPIRRALDTSGVSRHTLPNPGQQGVLGCQ